MVGPWPAPRWLKKRPAGRLERAPHALPALDPLARPFRAMVA